MFLERDSMLVARGERVNIRLGFARRKFSGEDTTLRPTPEQQKRRAQGHNRAGQNAPRWPVCAWYAAGRLRWTAHDMISFGEANLGHNQVNGKPVSAELIAAMQLAQKPIYAMPNGNKQAMAWGEQYGRRQSEPASHDCEERRNIRIRNGDRDQSNQGRGDLHRDEPGRS
jgi:CubicO group peptidase (beta-lactamase class C family)